MKRLKTDLQKKRKMKEIINKWLLQKGASMDDYLKDLRERSSQKRTKGQKKYSNVLQAFFSVSNAHEKVAI